PTRSRPLDWNLSGVDVLRLLRGDAHPVALLGAWAGGSDIIAANPVRVTCDPVAFTAEEPPSPAAASLAAASPAAASPAPLSPAPLSPVPPSPAPRRARGPRRVPQPAAARFGGGWIGYL